MRHVAFLRVSPVVLAFIAPAFMPAAPAFATDYLRGALDTPPDFSTASRDSGIDWNGVYGGAFVGYSSATIDPASVGSGLADAALPYHPVAPALRTLIRFGEKSKSSPAIGAFIGYNVVWDDVVLGVEADISRASFTTKSNSSDNRRIDQDTSSSSSSSSSSSDSEIFYTAASTASGKSEIKDWITLRGRVGWAADHFMPYPTAGFAFGNLTSSYTAKFNVTEYETTTSTTGGASVTRYKSGGEDKASTSKHNGLTYGIAIGAGLDYALFDNLFMRAEWQFVQFASDKKKPDASINSVRVAGAMKF